MPKYQIDVPGSGTFEVDSPTDLSDAQAYQAVMGQIKSTPAPKGGIMGALGLGTKSLLGDQLTGIKGMFGDANKAAEEGFKSSVALGEQYAAPTSMEAVKKAYQDKGLLSAAGEVASQIPKAIAQQAPQLAETYAGAKIGAKVAGPWGAMIGAAVPNLVQFVGSNLERQAQDQVMLGMPTDVSKGKAIAAAIPQTAIDLVETRLLFGSKFLSSALGLSEKSLAKMSAEAVEKQAQEKLLPLVLKGTAKGAAVEMPSEIAQQILERAQAGLSLTSADAVAEYGNTAYNVGLLGPLGIAGRASERSAARGELGKREGEAAANAAIEADKLKQQQAMAQPPAPPAPPTMPTSLFPELETTQKAQPTDTSELERKLFALQQQNPTPEVQQEMAALQAQIAQPKAQGNELRTQYDTLEREIERLKAQHATAAPEQQKAILEQAQKIDYARQELLGQIKAQKIEPRPAAPAGQAALDFNQPEQISADLSYYQPKTRLAETPIIGEQPQAQGNLTPEQELEFARQRRAAGAPTTPRQELLLREDAQQQQAAPAPELAIPQEVGGAGTPMSYVVDDSAIDTFGVTKGATKFKAAVRGLDLMNPEDAAKFDKAVEQHERKGAKIDMDAVEAFKTEKPTPVAAREVPERAGIPAVPYDARKGYQQAREAQFAFGQIAAPLSPRDVRAQKKAEYDERTGAGAINGPDERSIPVPSTGVQATEGTTPSETTGVGSAVGPATRPNGRTRPSGKAGNAALAQMAQQVAPKGKAKVQQQEVPRVETKEALEDQLAKEEVSADTEALMKELGIGPSERKPTTYRIAATETSGLTKERVEGIVKTVTDKWKNAPDIKTVQSEMQLPQDIQDQIKRDGVRRPEGVWSDADNCVFLIAGNIANAQNAVLTIAHETVGHFGIRGILGDTYLSVMNRIYEGNPEVKALADNKIDRGMDPATAVEEVLAELAENTPNPTVMQRIINIIRQAFAKVGFPMQGVTNGEIKQLLKDARNFVIEGKGGAKNPGIKIGQVYSADGPLFYSRLGAMVQHAPKELSKGATGKQWATWVKSNAGKFGVKKEELNWTGIEDLLATPEYADKKLTTSEVADLVKANSVEIEETNYGGGATEEELNRRRKEYNQRYNEATKPYMDDVEIAEDALRDFGNSIYKRLASGELKLNQLISKYRAHRLIETTNGDVNLKFAEELKNGSLSPERLYRDTKGWMVMQNGDFDTYSIYDTKAESRDLAIGRQRYKDVDEAKEQLSDFKQSYREDYEPNSVDIYNEYDTLVENLNLANYELERFVETYPEAEPDKSITGIYGSWTMEGGKGGKNYRELVLSLPAQKPDTSKWTIKETPGFAHRPQEKFYTVLDEGNNEVSTFHSYDDAKELIDRAKEKPTSKYQHGHWNGIANPIVHIRFNEKTDKDGNKVLFVEELQSDWGQEGYERGFQAGEAAIQWDSPEYVKVRQTAMDLRNLYNSNNGNREEQARIRPEFDRAVAAEDAIADYNRAIENKLAKAPFVTDPKSYTTLAVKRILRYAADNDYDKVAFISGEEAHKRFPKGHSGESTEKGMKTHYDVRIPSVLKDVLKQLGASTDLQTEEISVPKGEEKQEYFYTTRTDDNLTTRGPYDNYQEMYGSILERSEWDGNTNATQKFTEDIIDPDTQEVMYPKGSLLSIPQLARMDQKGIDLEHVFANSVTRPFIFTVTQQTKSIPNTKPFLTVNLTPEAAAKAKQGQALFREARTTEGKDAESLMSAFGGKPQEQERSFLEKKMGSFNKVKDTWTESYERNNDWVAATFGKGQNIASFDQAFNNRIYNHVMSEAKKGNLAFENAKKALLRISTSQALHRGNLANQIIELGDYKYDEVVNRWEAVDAKDGVNMGRFEGLIKSLATKLGVEPNRARQIMGAAYEANRLDDMYKSLDKTEKDIASLEQELSSLRKNRKRSEADKKEISLKEARLDKLKDLEQDLNGKVQHKTKAQVDAGMKLYYAHPEIMEGTKVWNKMRKRVVKLLVDTGVKTEDEAERWLDEAAYVPFFRDMEEQKVSGPQVIARGLRESMTDHRMKGSMKEVQDPIENMYQWMQWSISRAISNKQLQVMIEQYKSVLPEEVREGEGGVGNTFTIYYDGIQRKFNVADPAIAQAFVGLEPIIFPGIGAAVKATNALRHIITRFPLFSAVQLFSDSYTAMYTSGLKSPFGVLKEIAKEVAKTAQGTSETRKVLTQAGILETHDYSAMNEEDAIAKRLDLNTPSGYTKLMSNLDRLSSASDNVIRQGVYNQAIKEGLSHAEAMEKAAEIVNFRRISGDPRLQFASRVVPFFNAYLQVGSVALKTITGRGISPQERKAALATLTATSAKIAVLSLLYSMAVGDDEDYKRKNRVTRDRMFMIPGTGGFGIPIRADVFALPKIIGEYSYQMMADNGTTDPKMFKEAMSRAVMNSLHPPSEGIPQIVRPALGVMTNHDFFQDREIVNATMRRLDTDRQFTKSTSEMAKALGALTGMSPLNIDYILRGYFGSAMTLTALATNDAINVARGGPARPEMSAKEMVAALPNMSGFMSKDENTAVLSDFYEVARDVNKASATLKNMKHLPMEEQRAYREAHKKELQLKPMVQTLEKQLVLLKQREQMVRESPKMDDAKKRAELKRINDQRDRMVKNVTKLRQKMYE